jgi:molybdopterin adenylyltransferase
MSDYDKVSVGLVSISDRASQGVYDDKGVPALEEWLSSAVLNSLSLIARVIPDEQAVIENTLKELADVESCDVILTTGGTGPAPRDITPEATLAVADKVMPGFGEQMRQISLRFVPTAILSRQVAVIRGSTLIINLPGQPKSIRETLEGLRDDAGKTLVHGIFAAVPYCVDLIGGPYIETNEAVCKAFRRRRRGDHRDRNAAVAQPLDHLAARPGCRWQRFCTGGGATETAQPRYPLHFSACANDAGHH